MTSQDREYRNHLEKLRAVYFSDEKRHQTIPKNEIVMQQDGFNDKLYLILSGELIGYHEQDDNRIELFRAGPGMFVGVHSFFSSTYQSGATVIARHDTRCATIDLKTAHSITSQADFYQDFMPVVVRELFNRTLRLQTTALEKAKTMKQLMQSEKMASLGQMSAAIAHELNNALAVLSRNTDWLSDQIFALIQPETDFEKDILKQALQYGRTLSSSEIRQRTKNLLKETQFNKEYCERLSEMNVPVEKIKARALHENDIDRIHFHWQLAATLQDMHNAAAHASQVVKSVRALGSSPNRTETIDINENIKKAMALIDCDLSKIDVQLALQELPIMTGNSSEVAQIWINLLENACHSLISSRTTAPSITITTFFKDNHIVVNITDNGPGIPADILPTIFQPHVTTKVEGQSFGLGLGLAIVEKIIHQYGGSINVSSQSGKTTFTIKLSAGG